MFSKILIANRGEIACRIMRTAKALGIHTVAVFSEADRHARHVALADEAVHIGGPAPADSYLQMQRIVDAALATGSQAIHPGYGFLSENAAFCQLCAANGLTFVGPSASAIESMGSKSAAKRIMQEADVPLLPGYHGDDQTEDLLKRAADDIGYPVLLKAVAGGGGKGMRQVPDAAAFREALSAAKREALAGFGDDTMLVEKYLQAARHVEVQVFCDNHGHGVYLFERDCSVQRRHQKIIEEAPAPNISTELRQRMGEAAVRAAAAVNYAGAGTVEFLLDTDGKFYFMEMNTRLQVEHPVTEMITGTDLVEWQLQIAANGHLPKTQAELAIHGHAIEARIYAENPEQDFLPAAGTLWRLREPAQGPYVRIDTGVSENDEIGVFYDPMIAKLIVWGETRGIALQRLHQALGDYRIAGVTTNVDFLRRLSANPAFRAAKLRTDFIEQQHTSLFPARDSAATEVLASVGLYLSLAPEEQLLASSAASASPWDLSDAWRTNAASQWQHEIAVGQIIADQEETTISVVHKGRSEYQVDVGAATFNATATLAGEVLTTSVGGSEQRLDVFSRSTGAGRELVLFAGDQSLACRVIAPDLGTDANSNATGFKAPMNGTVVAMFASAGTAVAAGETLAIMEAMKMEHAIKAPSTGVVTDVFYAVGDLVDGGADLLSFEASAT